MADWFSNLKNSWNGLQDDAQKARAGIDDLSAATLAKAGMAEDEAKRRAKATGELAETAAMGTISPLGGEGSWVTSPAVADEASGVMDQLLRKRAALKRGRLGSVVSDEASAGIKDLAETSVAPIKDQIKARGGAINASEDAIVNSLPVEPIHPGPVMEEGRNFANLERMLKRPAKGAASEEFIAELAAKKANRLR